MGTTARRLGVLREFLRMPHDEARARLSAARGAARVVLTCPSAMCAVRPVGATTAVWRSAREEIVRNIHSFVPLAAGDALVGLIDRAPRLESGDATADPSDAGGYLVVADRRRLQPWFDAVRGAIGRDPDRVLSASMAALGLGLQKRPRAEVVDTLPGGGRVAHRLVYGEVEELAATPESGPTDQRVTLPGAENSTVSGEDLAIAAVLAPEVVRGFAPLSGAMSGPRSGWALPGAVATAAAVLLVASPFVADARYARATEALDAQSAARRDVIRDVITDRDEARRYSDLLNEAQSLLPRFETKGQTVRVLSAAREALPADAFFYRVDLDETSITVRGEARRSGDVLRAFEDSPAFEQAREVDPPRPVSERSLETFHIRALRSGISAEISP
ncbi:MAG: PilN domain-containing protein [Planctomycetota bacterium]|nr:PilN domain-containing protein [Planctomycetota bacterium]